MTFRITSEGVILTLWTDLIDLRLLGDCEVERASTIDFDHATQKWVVRVEHSELFTHESREVCLQWEHDNEDTILDHAVRRHEARDALRA
jgi:hypothetical protein